MEKVKNKPLYAQALASKVSEIKENFPNLLVKKIENIYKTINDSGKVKSRINMTTKDILQKQIIIPMSNDNKSKFIALLSKYIANLNSILKGIKPEVIVYFACINQHGIIITINKMASSLDLQTIKKYIKNTDHIDSKDIKILCVS